MLVVVPNSLIIGSTYDITFAFILASTAKVISEHQT